MASLQLNFVKDLPEMLNIDCPICFRIMSSDPNLTTCCGRHFCGACVRKVKESRLPACPLCKAQTFNTIVDKDRLRIINALEVYCSNQEQGCTWKGPLKKLLRHINRGQREGECPMEIVKCTNGLQNSYKNQWLRSLYDTHSYLSDGDGASDSMCDVEDKRHIVDVHEKEECPYRPYQCQYCEYKGTYKEVTEFHSSSCIYQPVSCPNACPVKEKFNRKSLKAHLKECPLQSVECEFAWAGCQEKPFRKDAQHHALEGLTEHFSLLVTTCKKLSVENEALRKENGVLESENETLRNDNNKLSKEANEMRQLVKKKSSGKL